MDEMAEVDAAIALSATATGGGQATRAMQCRDESKTSAVGGGDEEDPASVNVDDRAAGGTSRYLPKYVLITSKSGITRQHRHPITHGANT